MQMTAYRHRCSSRPPQDLVRGRKKWPHIHIFHRTHPCFIRTIRMAEGRCVAQEVLFNRSCARRNAHNTLYRAHRKDEGHHPVRRLSGSLKRKHAHGNVLSHGNYASVIENGQKNPASSTGMPFPGNTLWTSCLKRLANRSIAISGKSRSRRVFKKN